MKKILSAALALILTLAVFSAAFPCALTVTAHAAADGSLFTCRSNALAFETDKVIFAKIHAEDDAASFIIPSGGVSYSAEKRFGPCIGTESVLSLTGADGITTDYTVVVDGDTDCDGVSDVLDVGRIERALAGHEELTPYQCLAASSGADDELEAADYQNVVNIALGKPTDDILTVFKGILNSVKTNKPGFTCEKESTCRNCAITVSNFPISSLNVTDVEMLNYLENNKLLLQLTSSAEEYEAMVESVKAAYLPKVLDYTVQKGSDDHYYKFPVNDSVVSALLTAADTLGSLSRTVGSTQTVYTATLCDESFADGEAYVNSYQQRTGTYSKLFSVPQLSTTENVNGMVLKNGTVTVTVDNATGAPVAAVYSYTYELTVSTNQYMSQKNTVDVTESYTIG